MEREFEEEEVREAVFKMCGDKAPGLDGFPMFFFQRFWVDLKEEVMAFIKEFHVRGKLSKNLCASFIALIAMKEGADHLNNFRPIRLIGCIYKILAKVLASKLQ